MHDNVVVGSFFRKPLGLFAAIVVVGLIVIAVGMDQLDHFAGTGQWRRFVLFVRSTFRKDIKRLGPPTKLRDIHCGQVGHTTV